MIVPDLDAATAELAAAGVACEPIDVDGIEGEEGVEARGVRITGPAGATLDVVQPAPPGFYEQRIGGFIDSAAGLEGPPTEDLARAIVAVMADAWAAIDRLFAGVAHNKVLATHLLLGQQAREHAPPADSPDYWQRSAASTLPSGFVTRG